MAKPLQRTISILWWILVCIVVLLAVAVVAAKQLLPHLDDYREQIEQNISQVSGYQVSLGQLGGGLEGIDPTIFAKNVNMVVDNKSAVSVSEIRVRFDTIKSLLTLSPQFTYLRFTNPTLSLQERQGRWQLKGAKASDEVQKDVGVERILDYLMAQKRFSILNASVALDSEQFGQHELTIPSAYVFQQGQSSWVSIQAFLDGKTDPFSVNAKVSQLLGVFGDYQVLANIDVPKVSLSMAGSALPWAKDIDKAELGGKFWLNYRVGKSLDLQADASDVTVAFKNGQIYHASSMVRARYNQSFHSLNIDVNDLDVVDEKGNAFPKTNLAYDWSGVSHRSFIKFDQLDVGLAHKLASNFLQPDWSATSLLAGLQPQGLATNGSLLLDLHGDTPSYHYLSNLQNASIQGYNGIPKADHLNAIFSLTEEGGYVQFAGLNGHVAFPTVYDHGWDVDRLSGYVKWQEQQNVFLVTGKDLHIQRHGSNLAGSFRVESRKGAEDWLSLSLSADDVPVRDRSDYVPSGALNENTAQWLDEALASNKGMINHLDLMVQSDLNKGAVPDVRLKLNVSDADIAFAKDWPVAKQVNGGVELNSSGVHVVVDSGELSGLKVSNILVDLPLSGDSADWVNVKGSLTKDSDATLKVLRSTPLADSVLAPFDSWRISGPLKAKFDISVPLNDKNPQPKVTLALGFDNNPLYIGDIDLQSQVKKGTLNYSSEKGIYDSHFDVEALSGETNIKLTSKPSSGGGLSVQADMTGRANVADVAKWQHLPSLLDSKVSGDVGFTGLLDINKSQPGQVDFALNSNLNGAQLDLPPPFHKDSKEIKPLSLKVRVHDKDVVVQTNYDALVRAKLLIQSGEFVGGEVLVNSKDPLDDNLYKGLSLGGQLKRVDLSEWEKVLASDGNKPSETGESAATLQSTDSDKASMDIAIPNWLRKVDFIVDSVVVNPLNTIHNMKVTYGIAGNLFKVGSDELNFMFDVYQGKPRFHFGYIYWNTAPTKEKDNVTASNKVDGAGASEPPIHASDIPSMYLSIDKLFINQQPYGDWKLTITSKGNKLRVDPFSSKLNTGNFDGKLLWQDQGDQSSVELVLAVKGKDLAELTKKFSKTAFVTSKKYDINVSLDWKGNPFDFDRKTLSGHIGFDAEDGNAKQVDELPAFMKVFGIFNIASLRRRLSLDFSDVYSSGLTYDSIKGDFTLHKGVLKTTKPLSIISPSAELSVEGTADIVNETLDEVLTATLPITNSLPLAGLIWATPQVAGILYLTDKLIGDQISKVTSVQYKVEGAFNSPTITPITHKLKKGVNK